MYVGISGRSYADWIGPFYPQRMVKKHFLRLYAERFPTADVQGADLFREMLIEARVPGADAECS